MTGCLLGVSAELIQGRTGLNTDLFGRQCPELGSARAYQTSILAAPWPTPISALSASLIGKCGGFAPAAPLGAMTDAVRAERRRSGTGSARTSDCSRRPKEPIARGRARMRDGGTSSGGCAAAVHNALDADKRTTSHESALARFAPARSGRLVYSVDELQNVNRSQCEVRSKGASSGASMIDWRPSASWERRMRTACWLR